MNYQPAKSFTPDYTALIQNDPWYMQQSGLINAQGMADASRLGEQLAQAFIDYGAIPQGFSSEFLPGTTAGLAQANTQAGLSLLARLQRQTDDSRREVVNDLAARGILSSGETGWQLGRVAQASSEAGYDAARGTLNYSGQLLDAYAQAELARKLALIDAAMSAYGRQSTAPQNRPVGGQPTGGGQTGGGQPGTGSSPGYPVPSAQEIALMQSQVGRKAGQRDAAIRALYEKYYAWRMANQNPPWWQ